MKKVLSIQVPAPCPLACAFCRTPEHNAGNAELVLQAVKDHLEDHNELYITSNGETGLSPIFSKILEVAQERRILVSVLCATEKSVVPGLCRVEISLNKYTEPLALKAIEKAKKLGIPVVISMVDSGEKVNPEQITEAYHVDGVLVRALQPEGRSVCSSGKTRWFTRLGSSIGKFPVAAYRELVGIGRDTTCIDHDGNVVPLLGGAYA